MKRTTTALATAALALLVTGCAGNQPAASARFTEAQQSIEEAERAEAQRYATRELNTARETLDLARQAQEEGDEERAARLTERAQLDADYAAAVAENQELQTAVQELRDTLATLENELERSQQSSAPQSASPQSRF
jgi:hypothetical protein